MGSSCLDLGALTLVSTSSGLELSLSSQAHFAPSAEDVPHTQLTPDALASDAADRPLVRASNGLNLKMVLSFDDSISDCEADVLMQSFILRLKDAKFWRQLQLGPSSIEIFEADTSRCSEATIRLSSHRDEQSQPRRKTHKLCSGAELSDFRPPAGVSVIEMESMLLAFKISHSQGRKRSKKRKSYSVSSKSELANDQPNILLWKDAPNAGLNLADGPDMADHDSLAEGLLVDQAISLSGNEDRILPSARRPSLGSGLLKRCASQSKLETFANAPDTLEAMMSLLDAGLRMAIVPSAKHPAKDVRVTGNESFKHLADLAPAVWSPLHACTLSSRVVFLPTLSHALTSVARKSSRNATLTAKMNEVERRMGSAMQCNQPQLDSINSAPLQPEQQSLSLALWQVMQRKFIEPGERSRLRPLLEPSEAVSSPSNQAWDISDSTHHRETFDCEEICSDWSDSVLDENLSFSDDEELPEWKDTSSMNDSLLEEKILVGSNEEDRALDMLDLEFDEEMVDQDVASLCESVNSMLFSKTEPTSDSDGCHVEDEDDDEEMLDI